MKNDRTSHGVIRPCMSPMNRNSTPVHRPRKVTTAWLGDRSAEHDEITAEAFSRNPAGRPAP
jgi:hypothetical protein